MPAKWKIFLVLNFVLSIPALMCFVLLLINILNARYRGTNIEYLFTFLALFSLLLITLNGLLNTYLLQRFFPDKLLTTGVKRLNIVSFVLNILVAIGVLVLCIYGANEEFGNDNDDANSGKIALMIMSALWLVQVVVLILQGQLPGLINRNNREKIDSLIDSIGQ